jgi:hypothetical protein
LGLAFLFGFKDLYKVRLVVRFKMRVLGVNTLVQVKAVPNRGRGREDSVTEIVANYELNLILEVV